MFSIPIDEIVLPLSVRMFFVGERQKAQAILDILLSIFGLSDGKQATENGD